MKTDDLTRRLKAIKIEHTDIAAVTYHNGGEFRIHDNKSEKDIPPFYRVELEMKFGPGSFVRTEIWLPDNWNGRYIGLGNGGMAGNISYDSLTRYLIQNYAAANTDMGTSRGRDAGINNPEVWKDFGWRATHEMTLAAKYIIFIHYGKKESFSYFLGASTGGQQALMEAQRFAGDYNGIIAGVPANNRTFLHTYFLWNHRCLHNDGQRQLFTSENIRDITSYAAEFFQLRRDGAAGDNFVSIPASDQKTIDEFILFLRSKLVFNENQLKALCKIYCGPVNPVTKERIYNGLPIGSEMYGCGINDCQQYESPHFYPFIWVFGKDYDGSNFDFDKDLDHLNDKLADDLNANAADLSEFRSFGGKLLMYSGSIDPCVPYPDAKNYYERVAEKMGGFEKTRDFFRYFILPGRDHGGNAAGTSRICTEENDDTEADEFSALRAWVEENKAPDKLIAYGFRKESGIKFSRPMYPYPVRTEYVGGDKDFAGAFIKSSEAYPETPVCSDKYLEKRH